MTDTFGRPLRDLRISVTDRCNFRPRVRVLRHYELLRFSETERIGRVFIGKGV